MKKKKHWSRYLGIIIMIAIGAAGGFLAAHFLDPLLEDGFNLKKGAFLLLLVLSLYLFIFVQAVIHEGGHLIFGLLTGYKANSFRILNLIWVKEEKGVRLKKLSVAGTGGQCLMIPPEMKDGCFPYVLYNLGGVIMNTVSALIGIFAAYLFRGYQKISLFLIIFALVGFGLALTNGIPIHMTMVDNDGCNIRSLKKSPDAVRAFWLQMMIAAYNAKDIPLAQMPDEWFVISEKTSRENALTATIAVMAANRLMEQHEFGMAEELMEKLCEEENRVLALHKQLLTCDRIYVELIGEARAEVLDRLRTRETDGIMKAMKTYPSILRTKYVWALIREQDQEKAENIRRQFEKISRTYPYPVEIRTEEGLMDIADIRTN